jgi:hypothetical protein
MNDRPIDKVRNSALSITLPPDTGGIIDMGEINGALHMIGGSAIYRVQLADVLVTNGGFPLFSVTQLRIRNGSSCAGFRTPAMTSARGARAAGV